MSGDRGGVGQGESAGRADAAASSGANASPDLSRSVLDHLLEGFQVIGPDYRYLYVNETVVRHGKTTRADLLGRKMNECYPGIESTKMFSVLQECMERRTSPVIENEFTYRDGSVGWFELRFEPVPEGVAILSVDITERKRSEAALRRSMRALATLSRCNQALVRATDETSFVEAVCDLVVESGGYRAAWVALRSPVGEGEEREVARAGASEGDGGPSRPALSFEVRSGDSAIGTLTILAGAAETFDDDESKLLARIAQDLGYGIETLRARVAHASTQEQLVAAQRLEAIGRLAGGVAHDFNNLLSVILMYSDFAVEELAETDSIREDIVQVRDAGERGVALTRQLLAFSRKQILEPRVLSLNEVVAGLESMLRRLLGADIDIEVHPAGELGNAMADPGKIEQVIMNLAVNARDAMPEGGKLTIETANVELDESYAKAHVGAKPGRYVRLSVSDTGEGMSAEARARIFEPFFTTKEVGKGTGLGLSIVYGIVKQSGGNIWVYSEPGQGTTFKVYLPRVDAPAVEREQVQAPRPATGSETVLLVEDEPSVRKAAERILRSAGYRVLSAGNGGEALRMFTEHDGTIDLLLTDVVMPEMSGRELADRLKQRNPSARVLFTSGYTDNAIVHHGVLDAGTRFIGKPFSAAELTRKIREVLDGPE